MATATDPETAEKATGITSLGFVKEQSANPKGPRMIVRPKVAEGVASRSCALDWAVYEMLDT